MIFLLLCLNLHLTLGYNNTFQIPVRLQSSPQNYWRLNAAFSGYDVIHGDPMPATSTEIDPGIRNTIFFPVRLVAGKFYEWDGCSVLDYETCSGKLKSKVVTTMNEYRKFTSSMSSRGEGAGFKRDITVKCSDPDGMISISEDYEISASSSWSKSHSSSNTDQHLTKGSRAVSLAHCECVTNDIQLQEYKLPRFTAGFKSAVLKLASLSKSPKGRQQREFQKFMKQYGTHYISKTTMGARMVETKLYKFDLRKSYSKDKTESCSKSSSRVNFLWIHHESSEFGCEKSIDEEFKEGSQMLEETNWATYGSKPRKSIEDWASQDFDPIPLNREMHPIVNLLDEDILTDQGISIDYQALLDWILPMYINYGLYMGLDLRPDRGCGASVDCPFKSYCLSLDKKDDHICLPVEANDRAKQGWYLNHTDTAETRSEEKDDSSDAGYQRSDGTLSTWFTSAKNCCLEIGPHAKCLYKPRTLVCAITYEVTFMQNKNNDNNNNNNNNSNATENREPRMSDNGIDQGYPITAFYPRDYSVQTFTFEKDRLTIELRMSQASEEGCRRICKRFLDHKPKYSVCHLHYFKCVIVYDHVAGRQSTKDFHYLLYGSK